MGGPSVMVWGCFKYFKKSILAFISRSIDSLKYQDISNNRLLPFMNEQILPKIIFQKDKQAQMFQHLQKID